MPNSTPLIALLIGLALAAGVPATGVAETVSAEHGVAVGGDLRDSTITVGSSPEQVATLIRASNEALRTTYETQVKALSGQLDVTQDCVFHTKLDTDSTGNWTLIPCQTGQGFQGNLDT
jgi:hypothetical protein